MVLPPLTPPDSLDMFAETQATQPPLPAVESASIPSTNTELPPSTSAVPYVPPVPPVHQRQVTPSHCPSSARPQAAVPSRNQRPPACARRTTRSSPAAPRRRREAGSTAVRGSATRRTSGGRGLSFTDLELEKFLEVLGQHLPVGGDEWEAVTRIHQSRWPEANRSTDSLRRKFAALYRKRVPTGDPRIPPSVLKAKEIRSAMTARVDIGEGEDADADGFFSEEQGEEGGAEVIENSGGEEGSDEEARRPEHNQRSTTPSTSGPAFPIIHKRGKRVKEDDNASVTELIKATILQEQQFRAAARERYEQEREENRQKMLREDRLRAERREDEERRRQHQEKQAQLQREEDRKMRESYMQMLLMVLARGSDRQTHPSQPLSFLPPQEPNGIGSRPGGNQHNTSTPTDFGNRSDL